MYTLRLLLALLAGSLTSTSSIETGPDTDVLSCYTDEANAALSKLDPAYSRKSDSLDYAWSAAVKSGRFQNKSAFAPPYVLPIVFHIIHENGPENIPDADVQRSVGFLNQALANTDYYDPTTGANTQIQVCLAQRTPDNLPTNGIDRVESPLTSIHTDDDLMLKDLIRWEPREYINVWIVKEASGLGLGNGLAGYAYYPSAHGGRRDGIVMESRFLTRGEASVGVLIHELGHYLGLRHTFNGGCQNDDCTRDGDLVCDTPPDQSTVAVPCGGSANSCNTDTNSGFATDQNDMYINYMDYGYFRCYSAFTAGQRDRMHFFLDGIRRSLTESKGCLSPCPAVVTANYTGGDVTVNVGTTINFTNASVNGASFRWVRDGSLLSSITNYSETFNTVGTYRLKLVASPADQVLCQADSVEQVIRVVCPVRADFSFPTADYETGATITFTNSSIDGGSSTWTVDGTPVGSTTDLTYTFSTPGRYQVCLQESNGLCIEERCRSLVVSAPPCEVDAAFIYNSVGFAVGGTITFTNISTGGTTRSWTIDGAQVSMDRNLTWTFPVLGSFEVCVREGNGICEREFCRIVEVPQEPCTGPDCPGNEGCTEGFTYLYGLPDGGATEEVTAVLPDGDRFFISVRDQSRLWLMSVREDGSILWQTEIFPDGNVSLINEMILDDEGQLAAIGRTSLNRDNGDHSFMVRLDANTGNLLWARSYQFDLVRPLFNRVFNQHNTGNYTILGYTENTNSVITTFDRDGLFLTIDKADGNIITGPFQYPNNGSIRFNTAAYDRDIGTYYILGNIDDDATPGTLLNGTFFLTLDEGGTPLNNRLYDLQNLGTTSPVGIAKEGNELVLSITAKSNSPASHTAFLMRSSLEGDVKRAWAIPDLNGPPAEMLANNQEYTLLGDNMFGTALFQTDLIQLDGNGGVNWSSTVLEHYHPSSVRNPATPQMINTHDNQIVLAGSYQSLREASILMLDQFGSPASDCHEIVPGEVISEETEVSTSRLQFFAEPSQFFIDDFFSEPGGLVFNPEGCTRDCPELPDSCQAPYTLVYTEADAVDMGGFTAVVSGNNVHYVGGRLNGRPYVGAMHPDGTILWDHHFPTFDNEGVITDLILDDEGMLGGTGKVIGESSSSDGFAFRIDPLDGTLLWARRYNQLPNGAGLYLNNIFVRDNEYILTGGHETANSSVTNPALLSVNRADGSQSVSGLLYEPSTNQGFEDADIDPTTGIIYAMATNGMAGSRRIRVFAIAPDNQLAWAMDYQSAQRDFRGWDLLFGNNQLSIAATLSAAGGTADQTVYFQTDLNGRLVFSQSVESTFSIIPQALAWQGADLLLMAYNNVNTFSVVTSLDPAGTFPNAHLFGNRATMGPSFEAFEYNGTNVVTVGVNLPSGGPYLEVLSADSLQASSCGIDGSAGLQLTSGQVDLSVSSLPDLPPPFELGPFSAPVDVADVRLFLAPGNSCPADCNEPLEEICNNQIDDDEDGLIDCDDPDLEGDCCCAALPMIDLGADTTVCPGYVLALAPEFSFVTYAWSTGAMTDSIIVSEPGEYWLTVTDSCGNLASDTLTLDLRPRPLLDLGPDTTLCSNAIIPLLAQDGFATYEWVDGTTEKGFTGYGEGDFWVVATDSCGRVQTDTVNVTIDLASEINLGVDTLICPGDTLTFRLTGFSNYQWSESTFINCTNCPEVRFAPTTDTLLLVAAEFGGGCFSSDSIRVSVLPVIGNRDSVYLCPGDSVVFGDTTLFDSGQFLDIRQNSECEQIDTLNVFQLRDTLITETFSICQGDSIMVFDRFERVAGNYPRSYSAENGCDSTHLIELIVNQPVTTLATVSICAGDSTLIFGTFERTPGNYSRLFTAANQCDSTHVITLEVNTLEVSAEQLQAVCGAVAGAGEVVFNQQADAVNISWPDGTNQARNNNLAAGDYAITITTIAEGCTAVANLTIDTGLERNLSVAATPETCPGENDGTITITSDDLNGLSFSLNGDSFRSSPSFTGLSPSDYTLMIIDSLGCDQQFSLTVAAASEVLIDLPETISLPLGDSVTLRPQTNLSPGTYFINWSSTLADTCSNCPTLTLRPSQSTIVTATLTDINGCSVSDQTLITVNIKDLFYVPNAFSPNGDGVNDVFRIFPGPGVDRILRFSVFDRWGGRAYHAEDLSPTDALAAWDGRSPNGQLLSIGVHVYLIEVRLSNGEVISQAGEVLLMR